MAYLSKRRGGAALVAFIFIIVCTFLTPPVSGLAQDSQEKPRLNRMNLFSSGIFRPSPGNFTWLPDESAFLYAERGTWYSWDIQSGESKKLFTPGELRSQLMKGRESRAAGGMGDTNATGRFNRSALVLSPDGAQLLGMMDNDLYLLNLADGSARFITDSDEVEEFQSFSPDGARIAYLKGHDLFMLDIAGGKETRLTDNGGNEELWNGVADWVYEEELTVRRAFWWSPDGSKIAYLQFDTSPVPYFPIIDHLNRVPDPEMQKFAMVGGPNSIVRLGVLDVASTETTWVDSGEDTDVYIYAAAWNSSGSALLYRWMNRTQTRLELRLANPSTGASTLATADERDTWVNARIDWFGDNIDLVFLPDDSFLWASERSGFFHIYHFAANGELIAQLTDGDWRVEEIKAVGDDGWIYFSATAASPLERNLYRVPIAGGAMERLSMEDGDSSSSVSPNGGYFITTNSAIDRQQRISLHRTAGKELAELESNENPNLEKFNFNHTKIVTLVTKDGTGLYATLTLPPDFDESKKYPVIVYVYGGPAVQMVTNSWSPGIVITHQLFAAEDYIVWTLDNRGSWGRGHAFESVIHNQTGDWELRDQVTGVEYLRSLPYVDAGRIGVTGGSYGGYMTLMALFKAPEYFSVGVSQSPGVDWLHYDTAYTERYMGLPAGNPDGYKASDASQFASGLKGDLLLIHGMMDNNVHVQQSFQLIEALTAAGKDFEVMLYPRERHGISAPQRRMHSQRMMEEFFRTRLKEKK